MNGFWLEMLIILKVSWASLVILWFIWRKYVQLPFRMMSLQSLRVHTVDKRATIKSHATANSGLAKQSLIKNIKQTLQVKHYMAVQNHRPALIDVLITISITTELKHAYNFPYFTI